MAENEQEVKEEIEEETDEEAIERLEKETWSTAVTIFFYGIIAAAFLGYIIGLYSWIAGALVASLVASYSGLHMIRWIVVWGNIHTQRYLN